MKKSLLVATVVAVVLALMAPTALAFPSGQPFLEGGEPWSDTAVQQASDDWAYWSTCPEGSRGMEVQTSGRDRAESGHCAPANPG
jgi:hypothetical protein